MSNISPNDEPTRLDHPPLSTGQSLKQYRLEARLGQGGMGLVYRAYDTKLHRSVAIKLLSPEVTSDPDRKQRLLQEARAAARVNHPTIAQIYDADEQDAVTFIVMELVEGKTVRQLLQNHELDLLGAIDIAIQIAEGLAKAHELGIIHRDIKPANVMVTPEGHAKLLDFGLAKLLEGTLVQTTTGTVCVEDAPAALTQSGIVLGTPAYMSPEQVRGAKVDSRADIFSLGVLLYEMATGRAPFQRDTIMDSLHAVAFDDTPPMREEQSHIPAELQRIVSRCLRKHPEERYPDARILVRELRVVRRNTEAGLVQKTSLRQRILDAWEYLQHQPPSRYAWFAIGAIGLGVGLYLSIARIGSGGLFLTLIIGLLLYRHIRNHPQRLRELLVRKIAKIPEVRLIRFHDHQVTVVVDTAVAQLYGRINHQVNLCNRKRYWGAPMIVSIQHDLSEEQFSKMLSDPGVQYVRPDVVS
ncbi:MAG TPA: serine/threonine-protein kinase [Candidatus Paceibacterota bacterium]|nr:serine/threonine-protein kinase [Verrucomicrobiota bacterium]HRY50147.1 serine/threonine-protein kinase [Candidatus Paceibacterota bacterium]HSA00105.1 serine/threonine-protein kinase [Candidatus Paceibacterota bacterium]